MISEKNIILIDDGKDSRMFVYDMLRSMGSRPYICINTKEIRQYQKEMKIDLIISNKMMPKIKNVPIIEFKLDKKSNVSSQKLDLTKKIIKNLHK